MLLFPSSVRKEALISKESSLNISKASNQELRRLYKFCRETMIKTCESENVSSFFLLKSQTEEITKVWNFS